MLPIHLVGATSKNLSLFQVRSTRDYFSIYFFSIKKNVLNDGSHVGKGIRSQCMNREMIFGVIPLWCARRFLFKNVLEKGHKND